MQLNLHAKCAGVSRVALGPLLEWAAAVVPPRARSATPVFLFGTAGLRKLAPPQQGVVLRAARDALTASPFRCTPVQNCS
jgi:Golgi nucleoside diphosphatase